jgi:small-conductance mechanosensitive channel
MKNRSSLLAILLLLLFAQYSEAQENGRQRRDSGSRRPDSLRQSSDSSRGRRGAMSALFADSAKLTSSDYQLQIEKSYVTLDKIDRGSDLGSAISEMTMQLADSDSALAVLKENILNNSKALNLRNLQVFKTLLLDIYSDIQDHRETLDSAESRLVMLRTDMKRLVSDTIIRQLMRDSLLRVQFSSQMKEMRQNWRAGTTHLRESLATINHLQTHTSANSIIATQLLEKVEELLSHSPARIFGKEYRYLWETTTDSTSKKLKDAFAKAYTGERKALRYYFKSTGPKRLLLLLIGIIFFVWIYRNIRILKKKNALSSLSKLDFSFILSGFIVSSFIVLFTIAPLFDLYAPSVYVESMQFLLLITLTIVCWKKWPRRLFVYWIVMAILFVCFSFSHHIIAPGFVQRCWLMALNILSIIFGYLFLSQIQRHIHLKGFIRFVIILHNVMNIVAIICNIFGRFSLAQILGNAAIFAFTQAIGLAVFSKICMEAILLQISTSRISRGLKIQFDYQRVLNGFHKPILFLVVVLWLIVFTTNLNVYNSLMDGLTGILNKPRNIGNASFSIGSITLFFFIIWIAHLLQKYIGYFFGEAEEDEEITNKGKRSRLLVAKLVLLCVGYFLAVAASGLPLDKITIVLGALGVGIGLGLQNIVNNFVSGIVLIFDRPLQIGDSVEIADKAGRVKEIGLRSSTLVTQDGAEVIIPNGDILSQQIVNWTLSNNQQRLEMDLSITGSRDMEKVCSVIKKIILSSNQIFENREPQILFTAVHEDGFDLKVFFWSADVAKSAQVKSQVLVLLHEKLNSEDLHIR